MDKSSKIIVIILLLASLFCFFMFFVFNGSKTYSVTFDSDGGSKVDSQKVKENELVIKPADPTKDNAKFIAWQLDDFLYDFNTAVTKDLNLKAKWENIYTITALLEEKEYKVDVEAGDKLSIKDFNFLEKEGYVIKLFTEDNLEYDLEKDVLESFTLKAEYHELAQLIVKFDSNGGSKVDNMTVWEGSIITSPVTTKKNYNFDGWYLNNILFDFSQPVQENMVLKAKWSEPNQVNVTFLVDGTVYKSVSVKENNKITKPNNPTKTGYTFVEWQLNGSTYDFDTLVTSAITLEAVFKKSSEYKITFDSNGGSTINDVTVYEGNKVTKPTNPTRSGYTFVEWQLDGKKYDFNTVVTSDLTLTAKWIVKAKEYTVSFDSNGGSTVLAQTVEENKKVSKPSNPIRSGYIFLEWQLDGKSYNFNTAVTKNITLHAIWRVAEEFIITFNSNGGSSIQSQKIREGSKVIEPSLPIRSGYTFVEWQLDGKKYDFNTLVTKSITLEAIWKSN